jgi:hypothetical protein
MQKQFSVYRLVFALALGFFLTPRAFGAETSNYLGKIGVNVDAVDTSGNQLGWSVDLQLIRYVAGSSLFYGVDGGFSMPIPTSGNQLLMGGLIGGVEHISSWGFLVGTSVSLDAGQATQNGIIVGGNVVAVIKPQVYFGFSLGGGFRLSATGGYLLVSSVSAYSAPMAGLRVDFKSETSVKPVDD